MEMKDNKMLFIHFDKECGKAGIELTPPGFIEFYISGTNRPKPVTCIGMPKWDGVPFLEINLEKPTSI